MTTAQQGTYAAGIGKNWAQPGDPNFGQPGYMGQAEYSNYTQQSGGGSPAGAAAAGTTAPGASPVTTAKPPPVDPNGLPSTAPPAGTAPAPATGQQPPTPATPKPAAPPGMTMVPTQDGQGWVPSDSPLAWKPGGGTAAPAGGTPAAPAAPGVTGPPSGQPQNPADPTGAGNTQFMNTLLGLLNPTGTLDQNNPAISGAIAANNLALQRGAEAQRAQQAEVNAQTGTDASGGANTTNQGILEDMAAKQGAFAGQEVQGLQQQQNQNKLAAISALGGYLPQQQAQANQWAEHEASLSEQAREADVDAALQKLGIQTQGTLGAQDIALRDKLGSSQLGLQLLGLLLQGSEFGQSMDSQTLLGLMNSIPGG